MSTNLHLEKLYPTSRLLSHDYRRRRYAEQGGRGRERFRARSRNPSGRHPEKSADLRNYFAGIGRRAGPPPGAGKTFRSKRISRSAGRSRLRDDSAELAECYRLAIDQADAEKEITDRDLIDIIHLVRRGPTPTANEFRANARQRSGLSGKPLDDSHCGKP